MILDFFDMKFLCVTLSKQPKIIIKLLWYFICNIVLNSKNNNKIIQLKNEHRSMISMYMRRCSTSIIIRKCKSKPYCNITLNLLKMSIIKKTRNINSDEYVEKKEPFHTTDGDINYYSTMENSM